MNNYKKFPKTYHLPFSKTISSDDKVLNKKNYDLLTNKNIVVLEKLDGENTTLYSNYLHARSIDSPTNWTRDYITKKWSNISYMIESDERIICENLYAKHSIEYKKGYLEDYVYLLSVIKNNIILSWEEMKIYSKKLNLPLPQELYNGPFDLKILEKLSLKINEETQEGFVFRITENFLEKDYDKYVGKYVRKNHVITDKHWLTNTQPNGKPKCLLKNFKM